MDHLIFNIYKAPLNECPLRKILCCEVMHQPNRRTGSDSKIVTGMVCGMVCDGRKILGKASFFFPQSAFVFLCLSLVFFGREIYGTLRVHLNFFPNNLDLFIFVIAVSFWVFSSLKAYFCGCKYLPFRLFIIFLCFCFDSIWGHGLWLLSGL